MLKLLGELVLKEDIDILRLCKEVIHSSFEENFEVQMTTDAIIFIPKKSNSHYDLDSEIKIVETKLRELKLIPKLEDYNSIVWSIEDIRRVEEELEKLKKSIAVKLNI